MGFGKWLGRILKALEVSNEVGQIIGGRRPNQDEEREREQREKKWRDRVKKEKKAKNAAK